MTLKFPTCAICAVTVTFLAFSANDRTAAAGTPGEAIAPFVNDDTFAAAFLDLNALPDRDEAKKSNLFAVLPFLGDDAQAMLMVLHGVDQLTQSLKSAGAEAAYFVVGLADMHEAGGPVVVVTVREGVAPKDLAAAIKPLIGKFGPWASDLEVRPSGENALLVGRRATIERYASIAKSERKDLVDPLNKLADDGAALAGVFCPGNDFRRVVRELWPQLPGPLAPLKGELADRWRHLEVSLAAKPGARAEISLQASDAEAAALFAKLWTELPAAAPHFGGGDKTMRQTSTIVQMLVNALPANVEGNRVTLAFATGEKEQANFRNVVSQIVDASMKSAQMKERLVKFRNMSTAILTYESVKKHYPSAAVVDKTGRPLLSWRVAILPHLGQEELYRQFHLDEPWDSPHNRMLLEKMPEIYADPDRQLHELNVAGKTTYQVPVAPETIFHNSAEGTTVRDVTDGTVKTILIVEVEPAKAVEWTRPADWEVNVQEPLAGVQRKDRRSIAVAFADGHIETIPVNVDFKKLRGLLTRNGGEVFDWP